MFITSYLFFSKNRTLLVDEDYFIAQGARQIYPLVFNCQIEEYAETFFDFVLNDIKSLSAKDNFSSAKLTPVDIMSNDLSSHG